MTASAAAATVEKIWWLAGAHKYSDAYSGAFAPRRPQSRHMFGWDKASKCFVLENTLGISKPLRQTMPMPIELAEKFLLRCREEDFRKRMLDPMCDASSFVKETLEHGLFKLEVARTKDVGTAMRISSPSLFLSLRGGESPVGFVLCNEMRQRLGKSVLSLPERIIKEHLRA